MSYSKTLRNTCLALGLCATAAFAHSGVQNPAVMARMVNMSSLADQMKVLGAMAKGQAPFDAAVAQETLRQIATLSGDTEAHFEAQETDPKSEARAEIWNDFGDFAAKSNALETLAGDLAKSVSNLDALRSGLGQLGAACKACHSAYRE
jgi:cytochrome c556